MNKTVSMERYLMTLMNVNFRCTSWTKLESKFPSLRQHCLNFVLQGYLAAWNSDISSNV